MHLSVFLLTCMVFVNISLVEASYKDDQTKLFEKFGLKPKKVNKAAYEKIMKQICPEEQKQRAAFVDKQMKLGLIGWSTIYEKKPSGTVLHNIEFDHIPPGSAHPFQNIKENEKLIELFKKQAPTLAVSNFDHRSTLWKQCSTTNGDTPIMKKYKKFVEKGNHMCAIFSNIFCIKDIENHLTACDRIAIKPAFERYKDGFKSLINLHYDFGRANNGVLNLKGKASSAYCEIKNKEIQTRCPLDRKVVEGKNVYCRNVGDTFKNCLGNERNLKKREYDVLIGWMNNEITDKDMLKECDLENKWDGLFPKLFADDDKEEESDESDNKKGGGAEIEEDKGGEMEDEKSAGEKIDDEEGDEETSSGDEMEGGKIKPKPNKDDDDMEDERR